MTEDECKDFTLVCNKPFVYYLTTTSPRLTLKSKLCSTDTFVIIRGQYFPSYFCNSISSFVYSSYVQRILPISKIMYVD